MSLLLFNVNKLFYTIFIFCHSTADERIDKELNQLRIKSLNDMDNGFGILLRSGVINHSIKNWI